MKIVCISDTHGKHTELKVPDGDILIHAGDIGYNNSKLIKDFNNWLGELPHKYKVVIAGNHDEYIYYNSNRTRERLTNCIYLENEGCIIKGLNIWGSPISPTFVKWYFMADRGEDIKRYWDMIPRNLDILITHSPPYDILDTSKKGDKHLGCLDLHRKVYEVSPLLHIFGHIHGGYGQETLSDIKFVNASVLDEKYNMKNKPQVIEL